MHNDTLLPAAALTIDVAQGNKMGMLGLVADPNFSKNHFLYLAYNYRVEPFDPPHPEFRMRVVRYREQTDKLVEPKTLIEDIPAWTNHTGGRMRFAANGTLFVTTGDANNPPLAQRLDTYNGKILRLKTDGTAPSGNPYVHQDGARPEIWSYGHRNPQGLDFQPGTRRLLETEHGPLGGDEINWILPGHNYGWPEIDHRRTHEGMEAPFLEFSPSIAPGSASFYRGSLRALKDISISAPRNRTPSKGFLDRVMTTIYCFVSCRQVCAPQAIRRTLPRSQHLRHNGLLTPDLLPVAWRASSHSTAPPATARD
jgi:glucose/arabinose dehydrogenase